MRNTGCTFHVENGPHTPSAFYCTFNLLADLHDFHRNEGMESVATTLRRGYSVFNGLSWASTYRKSFLRMLKIALDRIKNAILVPYICSIEICDPWVKAKNLTTRVNSLLSICLHVSCCKLLVV